MLTTGHADLLYTLSAPSNSRDRRRRDGEPNERADSVTCHHKFTLPDSDLLYTLSAPVQWPSIRAGPLQEPVGCAESLLCGASEADGLGRPSKSMALDARPSIPPTFLPFSWSAPGRDHTRLGLSVPQAVLPTEGCVEGGLELGENLLAVAQVDSDDDCSVDFRDSASDTGLGGTPPPLHPPDSPSPAPSPRSEVSCVLLHHPLSVLPITGQLEQIRAPPQRRRRPPRRRASRTRRSKRQASGGQPSKDAVVAACARQAGAPPPEEAVPWLVWVAEQITAGGGKERLSRLRSRLCSWGGRLEHAEPFKNVVGGTGVLRAEKFLRHWFVVACQDVAGQDTVHLP
eukprot:TRINITY_DN17319_c0_g1_i4.p1 TRINITY_DN17319_c0_g1~~TRINITY_DN17319_c0_g1_i4.p1  ORF type:complete len:343 (+),score=48.75 TRINITY_DN17319_c0_g1_i4:94-1122(+)